MLVCSVSGLFGCESFFKEFFDQKTGGDAGGHFQEAGLSFRAAGKKVTKQIFGDVGGFEPICQLRHPIVHMLFVDVVLVFQIAYCFP